MFSNNTKSTSNPFQNLMKVLKTLFRQDENTLLIGEPLGYTYYRPDKQTRTSLEPIFNATRTPEMAKELENLKAISGDVQITLRSAATDVFSSQNGDVMGFWCDEIIDKEGSKIDPQVKEIADELFTRKQGDNEYVIGGDFLERAIEDFLLTGDSFLEIGYSKLPGKNEYHVNTTRFLPVWEMFVVADEQTGLISHYEQRRSLYDSHPIVFEPWKIVQFSYRKKTLYGQSLFSWQAIEAAKALREANFDIQNRSKTMSLNPDVFTLPEGYNAERGRRFEAYIRDKQARKDDDLILLLPGMSYQKGAPTEPDLSSHLSYIENLRTQIIPGGFPLWYYPGMSDDTKDLMGQPSTMYSRFRNKCCGVIAKGVREVLDNELILRLGVDKFQEIKSQPNGGYIIKFPEFIVNPNLVNQYADNQDTEEMENQDTESSNQSSNK